MAQSNVYTTVNSQAWFTDKARISTGNTAVTFQIDQAQLTFTLPSTGNVANIGTPGGNIYSNAVIVPANSRCDIYVGVGNRLTITGTGFTAHELGTMSSATEASNGQGS